MRYILGIIIFALGIGCVPSGNKKAPECSSGQTFDNVTRTCQDVTYPSVGAVKSVTINEDDPATTFNLQAGSGKISPLTYIVSAEPTKGTLSDCMDQIGSTAVNDLICSYTPDSNAFGVDTIEYKTFDGDNYSLESGKIFITINPTNDNPTMNPTITEVVVEDTPTTIYIYPNRSPYTSWHYDDVDGDNASACRVESEINITESISCSCSSSTGVCSFQLTPDPDEVGSELAGEFSYNLSVTTDGTTWTTPVTVYVSVTDTVDAPSIGCADLNAYPYQQYACTPILTDSDEIIIADSWSYALTSATTCTWLQINPTTGYLYGTPDSNDSNCTFEVKVTENYGATSDETSTSLSIILNTNSITTPFITATDIHIDQDSGNYVGLLSDAQVEHTNEGAGTYSITSTQYFSERSIDIVDCTTIGTATVDPNDGFVDFDPNDLESRNCYVAVKHSSDGAVDLNVIDIDGFDYSTCTTAYEDSPLACQIGIDSDDTYSEWTFAYVSSTCRWLVAPTLTDGYISGVPITDTNCELVYETTHNDSPSNNVSHTIDITIIPTSTFIDDSGVALYNEGDGYITVLPNNYLSPVVSNVTFTYGDFGTTYSDTAIDTTCDQFGDLDINSTTGEITFDADPEYCGTGLSACTVGVSFYSTTTSGYQQISVPVTCVEDPPTIMLDSWGNHTGGYLHINHGDPVPSATLTFDEGDGAYSSPMAETDQYVKINVSSSDTTLLPLGNIVITTSDTRVYSANDTDIYIDLALTDAGTSPANFDFYPVAGLAGVATITITATDSSGATDTQELVLEVHDTFAIFSDWTKLNAYGNTYYHDTPALNTSAYLVLEWDDMDVYQDGVPITSGYDWYLYRTEDATYLSDFVDGSGETLVPDATISFATRSYTDTSVVPGKRYYYMIRPVIDERSVPLTNINSGFSIIEAVIPPDNMVLVHHWMANKQICTEMNTQGIIATSYDKANNYRCSYALDIFGDATYFNFNKHLFVDRVEAGCPYTRAPGCGDLSNGCIGMGAPTGTGSSGEIYYNRTSGVCYQSDGASWTTLDPTMLSVASINTISYLHLPPLVNITQQYANTACQMATPQCTQADCDSTTLFSGSVKRLITRPEQMIASSWDLSEGSIDAIEAGGGLNSLNYCNSTIDGSYSNGLIYSDSAVPPPSFKDTLPFTFTSNYRSVRTGSDATSTCKSIFGIQDMIGNVREWADDNITNCSAPTGCTYALSTNSYGYLATFDDITFMTDAFDSSHYITPVLGFPMSSFLGLNTSISGVDLHSDNFFIQSPTSATTHYLSYGGSWYDEGAYPSGTGAGAGRYTADFVLETASYLDMGFRCSISVPSTPP